MREWKQGNLFGMTNITWKERQTNGSLSEKAQTSKKWKKYRRAKMGYLSVNYDS